ncbi:type VI secretion system baseplate subunit TssG [Paracoccus pacificus]|uniref:Type VI secretion system baseplate subunit TssG n=1 Tax=Paracoccus pacificus TaxID=1463598 RepID=A0ABW4R6F3_9RHOB
MTLPPGTTDGPGLLALLRRMEREAGGRAPVGRSQRLRDEIAHIGQDPYLAFPDGDFSDRRQRKDGRPDLRTQFLGFFGPQGALPLNTTEEVLRWLEAGDNSFVAFTDIFATRFLQLFFRAWSDAHAITQFDHPQGDRFQNYVATVAGVGTPAFREHDGLPDVARLRMVSLFGGRVRSPVRLRQMVSVHLNADVDVEEHVPSWMNFDAADLGALGQRGSTLGHDTYLGARVRSVNERIRLHVRARDLADYRQYLPGQPGYRRMAEIVFWYLGKTIEVEVTLSLPADEVAPARLGESAELGWMAALRPSDPPAPGNYVVAASFDLDPEYAAA